MQKPVVILLFVIAAACSSKAKEPATTTTASGAEPVAKGSDSTGGSSAGSSTGSAAAGSAAAGSAAAGSAATMGSGATGSAAVATGSGAGSAASWDFDKLTHDEQMDFMKKQVVPTMKPLFQAFDKAKYANFGCKTCHGKDPQKTKYKMPNPDLPKLDFAALKAGKQAPKVAEFMAKSVKPGMAKLLQQPEMNESTPNGFGCLECHQQKK